MTNPRQEEIDRLARDYEFEEDAKRARKPNGPTSTATLAPLTVEEWLLRPLPEPDHLLGELLSTTCRAILAGPTGLGKTMFGLAAAFAMADGKQFLHWKPGRKCRVLYVDGEISRREMKRRVRDAARRANAEPEGLIILCREDFQDMPPLNTRPGQKWLASASHKHRQREWDRKTLLDWKLPEEVALASLVRPKHPCSERGPIKAGKPWQFRFAA